MNKAYMNVSIYVSRMARVYLKERESALERAIEREADRERDKER